MRTRHRYDDKFRANACVLLEAAGYPEREGALSEVAARCKVPLSTLRGWFIGRNNPPPTELRNEKRLELKDLLKQELGELFVAMPNARPEASYRDLGTVAGILIDKLQLLEGKATERVDHTGLTDAERTDRVMALLDRGRARRDGRAPGTDD